MNRFQHTQRDIEDTRAASRARAEQGEREWREHAVADREVPRVYGMSIPIWAQFVAVDADGSVWAYADKPKRFTTTWASDSTGGRYLLCGLLDVPIAAWQGTLLERCDAGWLQCYDAEVVEQANARAESQATWRIVFGIVVVIGAIVLAKVGGALP